MACQPARPNARWAHLLEISLLRWEQGRLGELRDIWQAQVERFPRLGIARAWLALADLERGDRDAAQRALRVLAEQLPDRPRSGLWLPSVVLAALLAAKLDDAEAAGRLYPALLPYKDQVVGMHMEHPVACFGAASYYLALLAATMSRWTEAAAHFEAAIRTHERLGATPWLARTREADARMQARQGEAQPAVPVAEPPPPAPAPASAAPPAPAPDGATRDRFQREGEFWTVSYDGTVVRLKDSKGLRQIALLLAQPGRELHVTDLEALVSGPGEPSTTTPSSKVGHGELDARADLGDAGELLDAEARAAYKARLDELQEEIDEADEFNDPERAERARTEREFLIRELARAVGLGGRDRKASSHAERARLNATRAIRSAMTNLTREHPSLGQHLAATIRTGRYCSYTPDPRTPVAWEL